MVSVQPSKNVTGECYGNLRSGNVTWERLRNQAKLYVKLKICLFQIHTSV